MKEADVLDYDPFASDFGSPGDRTLRDKIVTARKAGECHDCAQTIQPGERIRSRTDVADGEIMSFRWCQACCEAMALWWTDDGDAMTARYAMRHHNQSGKP